MTPRRQPLTMLQEGPTARRAMAAMWPAWRWHQVVTPHGGLALRPSTDGVALPPALGAQIKAAFARGSGHGLLALGADHVGATLPPVLSYWRELGVRYVTALCALPGLGDNRPKPPVPLPADDALQHMAAGLVADARRGVSDGRSAGRPVASYRCRVQSGTGRGRAPCTGVPQGSTSAPGTAAREFCLADFAMTLPRHSGRT